MKRKTIEECENPPTNRTDIATGILSNIAPSRQVQRLHLGLVRLGVVGVASAVSESLHHFPSTGLHTHKWKEGTVSNGEMGSLKPSFLSTTRLRGELQRKKKKSAEGRSLPRTSSNGLDSKQHASRPSRIARMKQG